MTDFNQITLVQRLKSLSESGESYHGRAIDLRDKVEELLTYIPTTFAHYTSHSGKHSERIIHQISQLLFADPTSARPASISLSAVEMYILIASAYLHDSGMVVSEAEKTTLVESKEWKRWVSDDGKGGGKGKWQAIEEFRQGSNPPNRVTRDFLADRELRLLMAEYFRREHHVRSAKLVLQCEEDLGGFAFQDQVLLKTIADVCLAHGLRHHELEDSNRYPDTRDIRDEKVNVRFMAILLRLGDLLDMASSRACPLIMSAASPIPEESVPHWQQFLKIVHRSTTPELIEIRAECKNVEEHRLLQDWCQWLVDEVRNAHLLMARARRHTGWKPPVAEFGTGSIEIKPSEGATYVPCKWTFQFDQNLVLDRLIHHTYGDKVTFIRELLQNALDATRCQMYADLSADELPTPEYPTQVDEARRQRYPVRVSLREVSGEQGKFQILKIEDYGIGMDEDIIERYLLQIGRSFYTTNEFKDAFHFTPTSRFGIGFLSVFAVSRKINLETYKPSLQIKEQRQPLKLTLNGPKNYLLVEEGTRKKSGTSIEVQLEGQNQLEEGQLTELVRRWCRRVEFPIEVDDRGEKTTVRAESSKDFVTEVPDATDEGEGKFVIRAFPVNCPGLEGDLYVLARVDTAGEEDWRRPPDDHDSELNGWRPRRAKIAVPAELYCLHGISMDSGGSGRPGLGETQTTSARVDFRGPYKDLPLSRITSTWAIKESTEITSRWAEILHDHLETTPLARSTEGWKYKQRLLQDNWGELPNRNFWDSVEGMIHIYESGQSKCVSLKYLNSQEIITSISFPPSIVERGMEITLPPLNSSVPTLIEPDIERLSFEHRDKLFRRRRIRKVHHMETGHLTIDWEIDSAKRFYEGFAEFSGFDPSQWFGIGFSIFRKRYHTLHILNTFHPFVQWMKRVENAHAGEQTMSDKQHLGDLANYLTRSVSQALESDGADLAGLVKTIDSLRSHPSLLSDLLPPSLSLTREMFCLWPPAE